MQNPYSPLKVYVASRWDDRPDSIIIKRDLERRGVICTSTWLTEHDNQSFDALAKETDRVGSCRQRAIKDFEDIANADVFLLYSPAKGLRNGTGGKHVELGYALALGKPVYVYGERENIFHYHPGCRRIGSLDQFYSLMELPNAKE